MLLRSVRLEHFRNVVAAAFEPGPRLTVLLGANGQGKTNLLEAVYLLTTLRPLRATRLAELIRFGADRAAAQATVDGPGGARVIGVTLDAAGRQATPDGQPVDRLDTYLDGLAAVCFSPDDLLLVKGGPDGRRRLLDRAAWNRWPAVLGEAREYLRALRARNAALRGDPGPVEESFRAPLARAGARMIRRRRDVAVELAPHLAAAFAGISGGGPRAELSYRPSGGFEADGEEATLEARFAEALAQRLPRDLERGYTSCGPHLDDLLLAVDGRPARVYASQGQQRALVLSLRIAEVENLRAALGRPPLLLLDDVSSELDPAKNAFLLDYVARLPGQAILTATDRRLIEPAAGPGTRFLAVVSGAVGALDS